MIQPYDLVIANLKFIMIYFKSMSGLRINFHKNKVMVLGTNNMENDKALTILDWVLCMLRWPRGYTSILNLLLRFHNT
jgi:hypothetical protein